MRHVGGFYIRKTELLNEPGGFYLGDDICSYLLMDEEVLDIDVEDDMWYFEFPISDKKNKTKKYYTLFIRFFGERSKSK